MTATPDNLAKVESIGGVDVVLSVLIAFVQPFSRFRRSPALACAGELSGSESAGPNSP